ncbi:MAG TPA: MBL fold metallo-hydrolase [Solirubrobacteraceae bacterium]|jgi:L-ascorbate metabolism protein UlaG (beta-lactamase superfamily)|nr:MBL fold metallo-hydrolase [Solirubrobacteraceae bacterium]
MHVEWFGQSAFALTGQQTKVFTDPFADLSPLAGRGMRFEYPPIRAEGVDLLLVTHEHLDHNGVEAISGDPATLRSTAGRLDSPVGEVVAIASEHDERAGTERGPNTIFVFELDSVRVAHFGDFGQRELRDEQAQAIGQLDLLILPVGGGPTIGAAQAAAIAQRLAPRWVVPMHYRTPRIDFLQDAEEFLGLMADVRRLQSSSFDTADLSGGDGRIVVLPAAP